MLIEIRCDLFNNHIKNKTIKFSSGINVVLGDDVATNSIGKSSLLLIIDYIYGGETFIARCTDVIEELGHHEYNYQLKINEKTYFYKRKTDIQDEVYICNKDYEVIDTISVDEYRGGLKELYSINEMPLTFRSIFSLYSRIWGKENNNVNRPLQSFDKHKDSRSINDLISLFEKFNTLKKTSIELAVVNDKKKLIQSAFKENLITKTGKREHVKNLEIVSNIDAELDEVKSELAKYAANIGEIVNKEIQDLKEDKDRLLEEKFRQETRLERVKIDLLKNRKFKSRQLDKLEEFFPSINLEKISEAEKFHSDITKILRPKLKKHKQEIELSLRLINDELKEIDNKMSNTLSHIESPSLIVDRVYELSTKHAVKTAEIKFYSLNEDVVDQYKKKKLSYEEKRNKILKSISKKINDKTRSYVDSIYSSDRRSPILSFNKNNYTFSAVEDTGTGTAYSSLILFDLAVFELTKLPFIIHDSFLFKNIQNSAVSRLIELYNKQKKQVFISIDEINKYGEDTEKLLLKKKVVRLTNSQVLYVKDWRKGKN